jgi:hypothetical protein
MAPAEIDRETVRRARERLDEWTYDARDRAFSELFEGADAAVTEEELALLDRIDADLTRRGEVGLWGADEYGVVVSGTPDAEELRVVCTYHPKIPFEGFRGEESLEESTREEFNDLLWDYCERVARHLQRDLEAFLRSTGTTE